MIRTRLAVALAAGTMVLGFGVALSVDSVAVAPPSACDTAYPSTSSNGAKIDNLKRYNDCRFDRLEDKIDALASAHPSASPSPSPSPSSSSVSPSPSPSSSSSSASPTPSTSTTPASAVCTNPVWTSTQHDALFNNGGFIVHNNQWNAANYTVTQTVEACTYKSWNAIVRADNNNGDGAVKTYPNVHKDYINWGTRVEPPLSNYPVLRSTFAADAPDSGIYNFGYDIWLNGVGNGGPNNREVMIWTDNQGQRPAGAVVATGVSLGGKSWNVWATGDNHILTFVAVTDMTSGTVDIRAHLDYLLAQGRIPATSTLGQVCFGVEVVSTGGAPMTFNFTDFSLTDR